MTDVNAAQQIITDSLVLLGVVGDDENPTDQQSNRGLNILNDLLDAWSADRLTVYTVQEYVFPFGPAASYTVGPNGNFDMAFTPLKIEEAYCQVTTTEPMSEVPIRIVEQQEWAMITVKDTVSSIPRTALYDYQWPLSNITFFPIPQAQNNVALWCWQGLGNISSLTTDIILPPGYKLALKYELATVLAPFFGADVTKEIAAGMDKYGTIIRRRNLPEGHVMQCDLGTLSPSKTFNWLTGEAR